MLLPLLARATTYPPVEIAQKLFAAEKSAGLPYGYLVALAAHESKFSNSAMNIDGVSFWFDSEPEALSTLYKITKNPFYISGKKSNGSKFKFFANSEETALSKVAEFKSQGVYLYTQKNGLKYRKLYTRSTDVCMLQINNHYHIRDKFTSVNDVLDLETCIEYGAAYLKAKIDKHGLKNGVGCYHNCHIGSDDHSRYIQHFASAYQSIFSKPPF